MFSRTKTARSTVPCSDNIQKLQKMLADADAVIIGAGAGLSASAGFIYQGDRFETYFADFAVTYGFSDMYTGGFYPFASQEAFWAYWSRYIWINRYMRAPRPVYEELYDLVKDKDYFVLTTNVDHCFQKAGFDKKRLFYTQGDYGLFQCSEPCHDKVYDNEAPVRAMIEAQNYVIAEDNALTVPEGAVLKMTVPSELLPRCPVCGRPMRMNLRSDNTFVEDEGWHRAAERYENFLRTRGGRILFLELGVGYNTPVIIKYPFWNMTADSPDASYACINYGEAACPEQIRSRSVCLNGDIGDVITAVRQAGC